MEHRRLVTLDDILEENSLVFIDNNLMSFRLDDIRTKTLLEKLYEYLYFCELPAKVEEINSILSNENVYTIVEVAREFKTLKNVLRNTKTRCIKKYSRKDNGGNLWVDDINDMYRNVRLLYKKLFEKGNIVEDCLSKDFEISDKFNLINSMIKRVSGKNRIKKDRDYDKKSITDEKLVSVAMTFALAENIKVGLISNDADVRNLIQATYKMIASKFLQTFGLVNYEKIGCDLYSVSYDTTTVPRSTIKPSGIYYHQIHKSAE